MSKYLDPKEINFDITVKITPLSQDTYDEREIIKTVSSVDANACYAVALQFALVGIVNGNFGFCKFNEKTVSIKELMDKNKILYRTSQDKENKLEPGDLTPKRLARLFRLYISNYIKETGQTSFLFYKYNPKGAHPEYCFPTAEYLVTQEESTDLLIAYETLDKVLEKGTNFHHRVSRIVAVRSNKS
mmetsp:Transcript_32957/g.45245  ORF Transcript_32957/g.45245 Transcript_32957/m.45245 type:complete len:187 (+) Transcript_32957:105-665(+)